MIKDIFSSLNETSPLSSVSKELRDELRSCCVSKRLEKNQTLWAKGDSASFFAIITEGVFSVFDYDHEGNSDIRGFFGPGNVIGLTAFLADRDFPLHCISCGPSKVLIARPRFHRTSELSSNDPISSELNLWMRKQIFLHEEALREKIEILSAKNVDQKLEMFFRMCVRRFNLPHTQSPSFIPFPFTKTQIAKYLGVRVETAIRKLNSLEKQGRLRMSFNGISFKR